MAQPPPAKRQKRGNPNDTIEIRTTDAGQISTTTLFKNVAAHYAPKFVATFQLSGIRSIELEDVSRSTVRLFNGWLRKSWSHDEATNKLSSDVDFQEPDWTLLASDTIGEDGLIQWWYCLGWNGVDCLINVFIFAESYDIPRLRHDAIDRLVWCFRASNNICWDCVSSLKHLPVKTIKRAYKHTPDRSALRRVLVDGFCAHAEGEAGEKLSEMTKDFVVGVARRALIKHRALEQMPDACEYHDHETEEARKPCESRIFPRENERSPS